MSFLDKLENYVYLPLVVKVLGVVILGVTLWSGVHGFFPKFGVVAGALALYVGSNFNKVYK